MAEQNTEGGNNGVNETPQNDQMAKLQSEASALEMQIIAESSTPTANPEAQTQSQDSTIQTPEIKQEVAPQAKPPDEKPVEVPKQFQDKDGNASLETIEKSSEHLRKKNEGVKQSLERYKALQSDFLKGTQELKKLEREVPVQAQPAVSPTPPASPPPVQRNYPDDLKQKIAQDLESDLVGTILSLIETGARHTVEEHPEIKESRKSREERAQRAFLSEVDSVAKDGNDWILTQEGFDKIQQVFQDRPYLKQSPSPVRDALRFIDSVPGKGSASDTAQVGPRTPILGAGSAVPPPSLKQTVSAADELVDLNKKMDEALRSGDTQKWAEYSRRSDELLARSFAK